MEYTPQTRNSVFDSKKFWEPNGQKVGAVERGRPRSTPAGVQETQNSGEKRFPKKFWEGRPQSDDPQNLRRVRAGWGPRLLGPADFWRKHREGVFPGRHVRPAVGGRVILHQLLISFYYFGPIHFYPQINPHCHCDPRARRGQPAQLWRCRFFRFACVSADQLPTASSSAHLVAGLQTSSKRALCL